MMWTLVLIFLTSEPSPSMQWSTDISSSVWTTCSIRYCLTWSWYNTVRTARQLKADYEGKNQQPRLSWDYIMYIKVPFKKVPCCALENESVPGDVQTIYGWNRMMYDDDDGSDEEDDDDDDMPLKPSAIERVDVTAIDLLIARPLRYYGLWQSIPL